MKKRRALLGPAPCAQDKSLAAAAAFASAAVARLTALARDFALFHGVHRGKSALRSSTPGCWHVRSPFQQWGIPANAYCRCGFTMLMRVRNIRIRSLIEVRKHWSEGAESPVKSQICEVDGTAVPPANF
jgi:hypothetical protein